MHMTYDAEADVLNISFTARSRPGVHHEKVADGVYLGWAENRLADIQVLQASRHVLRATLEQIDSATTMCTPRELAKEHGLAAGSIANAAAAGRLPGAVKRGGTWFIPSSGFVNYLEARPPSGRPPKSAKARRARKRATTRR
jgi:hypothetical protein